jgi:2-oxoglutarate ferredoxin oxidoreductase subunit alpha
MAGTAFDLAERLQTPVFVMSDLDLGMNTWVTEPPEYPEKPLDRGKVVTAEQIRELEQWGRYMDVDGDGIPRRSIAGNEHPLAPYLARGTGHNEHGIYSERAEDWERNMARIARKYETARTLVPQADIYGSAEQRVGIITVGSNHEAVQEARDQLRAAGIESGYLRLRSLPISQDVRDFIGEYETIFVVEMNHDGQLCTILRTDEPAHALKLVSVSRNNGWPLSAKWITNEITSKLEEKVA